MGMRHMFPIQNGVCIGANATAWLHRGELAAWQRVWTNAKRCSPASRSFGLLPTQRQNVDAGTARFPVIAGQPNHRLLCFRALFWPPRLE